jgi:hypothetical protein
VKSVRTFETEVVPEEIGNSDAATDLFAFHERTLRPVTGKVTTELPSLIEAVAWTADGLLNLRRFSTVKFLLVPSPPCLSE